MKNIFYSRKFMFFTFKRKNKRIIFVVKEKSQNYCTAPQKLDIKNLTFGVFFYEINL